MPLDRAAVVAYAKKHWFNPCDDGIIMSRVFGALKVEDARRKHRKELQPDPSVWKAVFIPAVKDPKGKDPKGANEPILGKERACFIRPNPNGKAIPAARLPPELQGKFDIVPFHEDDGLVDCAHFISRSLTAGGIATNQPGVPGLVSTLRHRSDTKTLGHRVTKQQGDRILNTGVMKPGDLVTYFSKPSRDYTHSTLYLGFDARLRHHAITCHTVPRFAEFYDDSDWSIIGDNPDEFPKWRFTLIHFVAKDERRPTPLTLQALQGWWKVAAGGRTEFYHFAADGKVAASAKAPARASQPASHVSGSGYWFETVKEIILFFPEKGQVQRWGVFSVENFTTFNIQVDNFPGQATRLFS